MDIVAYLSFIIRSIGKDIVTDRYRSIHDINFNKIKCKLYIFDVDDTLSPDSSPIPEDVLDILRKLNKKAKIALVSNCSKKRKAELKQLGDKEGFYVEMTSLKPSPAGILNVLSNMKINPHDAAVIGDKISMDCWSAYQAGVKHRILLEPYSEVFGGKKASFVPKNTRTIEKIMYRWPERLKKI